MQIHIKDDQTEQEIKELINKKMTAKGIDPNQRVEMNHGGAYLNNVLFDFAVSFHRQARYKAIEELKVGIENLKEY